MKAWSLYATITSATFRVWELETRTDPHHFALQMETITLKINDLVVCFPFNTEPHVRLKQCHSLNYYI